ncbi:hypothetical protein B0H15DRAFT_956436 [Mycena belliarum]|uniref:F-box domain-containing protein n=1 Tax=Mycena belliarum TaxID=1033014 RepID=A0AAD6XJD6_9AGAR|nr:hypothetical protein B0H15DRAFT_956436 [Mycena belliae]
MVSADNVNLDVLELIFSYLAGNDLPSVALVSRSFFAGVIPRLYCTLLFRLSHAKRYPAVISPFSAVAAHPEFAIHVRHVDIRTVPIVKAQYNPKFLLECTRALELCHNITSFRCSSINALPPFLPTLQQKDRLRSLRVYASLTTEQSLKLVSLAKIRHLTLDFPSWNLMNLLPRWTGLLQNNLTTLTLFMANELNEMVLESALVEVPHLLGLHVVGCPKVDHLVLLSLLSHTPDLESLSMTTGDCTYPLPQPPAPLTSLRALSLDTRITPHLPPSTAVLSAILTHVTAAGARLRAFVLKFPDRQLGLGPGAPFVAQLLAAHARSLTVLAFLDCTLGTTDALPALCGKCTALERLEIAIPVRDLTIFTRALAHSKTLRTLIDVAPHAHSVRPTLAQEGVSALLAQLPSLRTVVSGGRVWSRRPTGGVTLERRPTHVTASHWFMPRD